jgi:hypothetical protein
VNKGEEKRALAAMLDQTKLWSARSADQGYIQSFRSIAWVVAKHALLTDADKLWPLWPCKVGQPKNPSIMSCILLVLDIQCAHDKNWEMIKPLVMGVNLHFLFFGFGPWAPVANKIRPRVTYCTYEQKFHFQVNSPSSYNGPRWTLTSLCDLEK